MAQREFNKVNIKVEFNEAETRQQINSGESVSTLFGKIKKIFSDLKAVAFTGDYNDLRNKPNDVTYGVVSTTENGLVTPTMLAKLNSIETGANKYTHPTHTAKSSGLYKVTIDGEGHISAVEEVTKADITALGIPAQDTDTTYNNMTAATASTAGKSGLVPAPTAGKQASFLRGDGTWAIPTNTTYGTVTESANGLATPSLLKTVNNALPKSGGTMTGALIGQANTNYTTAQFRNITMSTSNPSGGSNGQIHFQYS